MRARPRFDQVLALQYVTTDKAAEHRAVVEVFPNAKARYRVQLRSAEVLQLASTDLAATTARATKLCAPRMRFALFVPLPFQVTRVVTMTRIQLQTSTIRCDTRALEALDAASFGGCC